MKALALASVALLATVSSPVLAADLLGATATATLLYPDLGTVYAGPVSTTVDGGVEFPAGDFAPAYGSFDIGANTITFFSNQSGFYGDGAAFNGYRIDFSGTPIALTSLTIDPSSTFTPLSYYLSGNSVFFSVTGQDPQGGNTIFNIGVSAVPEPASWAMMIGGFGMIGSVMRRRKSGAQLAHA